MQTEAPSPFERRAASALAQALFFRDRRGGAWLPPAHLPYRDVRFESPAGADLAGWWFPAERAKGAVVLVHPDRRYAKHWFVREGWVEFLRAEGYDVLAFDLTSYGDSRGKVLDHPGDVVAAARFAEHWGGRLPVHVVGVSMGAFAAANAAPELGFVRSLVLESPYPSVRAWYGDRPEAWAMRAFDAAFPRVAARMRAETRIARAGAKRILVALAEEDDVTPPALTEAVARAAPAERTRLLRVPGVRHLELFGKSEDYRRAVLETLGGG